MKRYVSPLILLCALFLPKIDWAREQVNPPDFYRRTHEDRINRVNRMREKIDLQAVPRYRTDVSETKDHLIIKRQTWTVHFSKRNGIIDRVDILDVTCDRGCALPNLEISDAKGTVYRQSNAKTAEMKINDQKFHLFLNFTFSPISDDGKQFPAKFRVEYDLFKMGSMFTVRHSVVDPGDARITRLVVYNSIGKVDDPLRYLSLPHTRDNDGRFRAMLHEDITSWNDRDIYSGTTVYSLFTNGRIGFEVAARRHTWEQFVFDNPADPANRVQVRIRGGNPATDVVFVNHKNGISLKKDQNFDTLITFLPFRKYEPTVGFVGNRTPGIEGSWTLNHERDLRYIAARGAQEVHLPTPLHTWWPISTGPKLEESRKMVAAAHKYDMRALNFTCVNQSIAPENVADYDEMKQVIDFKTIASDLWHKDTSSLENPAVRDYYLDAICARMSLHETDGTYFDLNWCYTAEPGMTPQIEGSVRFYEDVRLLTDSFGEKKWFLIHSGEELTPLEAMADTMYPGEPHAGKQLKELLPSHLETGWNPFLAGCQVTAYTSRSYDFSSPRINKQFFRNAVVPIMRMYGMMDDYWGEWTPEARASQMRLYLPLFGYDIRWSEFHHWRDTDAKEYARPLLDDLCLNIYGKPDKGVLVSGARLSDDVTESTALINVAKLGMKTPEVFVYDVLCNKLEIVKVENGWAKITCRNIDKDPIIVNIKPKNGNGPAAVWTDYNLQLVSAQDNTWGARQVSEQEMTEGPEWGSNAFDMKLKFRVCPDEGHHQRLVFYCGDGGWPMTIEPGIITEYHPESRSIVLDYWSFPLGEQPFKEYCRPYDGPAGQEFDATLRWGKSYQPGFPDVGRLD